MDHPLRTPVNKIPGELPTIKSDHYIQDLTKLTRVQLIEIKEREEKLMTRIPNLNRLPDKGRRIKDFYEKVRNELERQSNIDEAAEIFSRMNITSEGQEKLNKMEWNGTLNADSIADVIDSDDEAEMNPLKIIAQRSMHEKKVQKELPEESLITQHDLEEIRSFENESDTQSEKTETVLNAEVVSIDVKEKIDDIKPLIQHHPHNNEPEQEDHHLEYLVNIGVDLLPTREKFKPYYTTVSNVHSSEKEKIRKVAKNWENTAATPPLIQHGPTKMLSLTDSVDIQKAYLVKLKDLHEKQAAERLAAKVQRLVTLKMEIPSESSRKDNPAFTQFREPKEKDISLEGIQQIDEDDQVEDLDDEKPGGVIYTVFE